MRARGPPGLQGQYLHRPSDLRCGGFRVRRKPQHRPRPLFGHGLSVRCLNSALHPRAAPPACPATWRPASFSSLSRVGDLVSHDLPGAQRVADVWPHPPTRLLLQTAPASFARRCGARDDARRARPVDARRDWDLCLRQPQLRLRFSARRRCSPRRTRRSRSVSDVERKAP
jgi:hypothetical protein